MKFKRITAITMTSALISSFCTAAFAEGEEGQLKPLATDGYDTTYVMTIPAELDITKSGFNALGDGIKISHSTELTTTFDPNSKVNVKAESANNWKLKAEKTTDEIGYQLKGTANDNDATTTWEFTGSEVNQDGGTIKAVGVDVENYDEKAPGEYTDTITFTAEVQSSQRIVDLSTLTDHYEAQDGDILTGELADYYKITIADNAAITLRDVTIEGENSDDFLWAGITANGDATITLEGMNKVKGFYEDHPGIYVPENKTLTIKGEGTLEARSNGYAPGIGVGYNISCGNITIEGGNIIAYGGNGAAGIGSGVEGNCGNITISGGQVTAYGGVYAAGIGSGYYGNCGNITISGGNVSAIGGEYAAGIGTGSYDSYEPSNCGDITIGTGVISVKATKGADAPYSIGTGLSWDYGDTNNGTCGKITIGGEEKGMITDNFVYPAN